MKGVIKIYLVMADKRMTIDKTDKAASVDLCTRLLEFYISRCSSISIDDLIDRAYNAYSEDVKMTPHTREVPDHGTDCPDRASIMRDLGELCWHFLKGSDPLAVLIRNLMTEGEKIPDKVPHRTPLVDWLDGSDVMRALHISPRTLQTLRSNGTLPYSHIGGKILYKREVLEDLLERNYATNLSGKEGTYGK